MKRRHITGFYIETLVLIVIFVTVVLVLTQIFGVSRSESRTARRLTNAVTLAENAAEAVSASKDQETLVQLLNTDNNAWYDEEEGVLAYYDADLRPSAEGPYLVQVGWEPQQTGAGALVNSQISVWYVHEREPLYVLETAVYLPEVKS